MGLDGASLLTGILIGFFYAGVLGMLFQSRSCYALCGTEYDKLGAWNEKPIRAT